MSLAIWSELDTQCLLVDERDVAAGLLRDNGEVVEMGASVQTQIFRGSEVVWGCTQKNRGRELWTGWPGKASWRSHKIERVSR